VFAPGQAYVALSRLRSLDGLVLLSPMRMNGLTNDQQVMQYTSNKADEEQLERVLKEDTVHFLYTFLVKTYEWRDTDALWRVHDASYALLGVKSEKGKHRAWSNHQASVIHGLIEPSQKFINQLHKLFSVRPISLEFILERVKAANQYFTKPLEGCAQSTLKKMEEVKRIRKIKAYFEELEELDNAHFEILTSLKRTEILLEKLIANEEITKDIIWKDEVLNYRKSMLETIKAEQQTPVSLMDTFYEDEPEEELISTKKAKGEKAPKKSTYEVTLELIQENKSIAEVAAARVMSEGTITSHIVKLIKMGQLDLAEVLPKERISQLEDIFDGYNELSLSPLKERVGDEFTWDELKLYRASLEVGE
ncbi:MAG: helix-turn-helix domain-containing protein, partial [Crocinitomicaceae bacterium]|nr:helix-turn-helix domain-containing protein [Crocinitomicaceae bacterium]